MPHFAHAWRPGLRNTVRRLLLWAALALGYALLRAAELRFPTPFGSAAPLAPAAGWLLAAAAIWGLRALVPLAGGAAGVALVAAPMGAALGGEVAIVVVQIALAARLMHASSRAGALLLDAPAELLRRLLVPAVCVAAAGAATALLLARALGAPPERFELLARFVADLLGMLIVTPIALCVFGQPRQHWAARRLTLGLPMTLATLSLMTAFWAVARWDQQRAVAAFEAEVRVVGERFENRLRGVLNAAASIHGVMEATGASVSSEAFEQIARPWFERAPGVRAIGWHELVRRDRQAEFEHRVQVQGEPGFRVRNVPNGVSAERLAGDEHMLVMRHVTSKPGWAQSQRAIGINVLSLSGPRDTALAALREGGPRASGAFKMYAQEDDQAGFVVYRPLLRGAGGPNGSVFVAVFVSQLLEPLLRQVQAGVSLCIFDADPSVGVRVLTGSFGCELAQARADELIRDQVIAFAGRQIELRVRTPLAAALDSAGAWNVWFLAAPGMLGAVLLSALLLVTTGRVQRTEAEVRRRTEELRREVEERRAAEEALQRSQREQRTVFDTVEVGLVQVDPNGAILDANPFYCELVGYSLDELRRMSVDDLTPAEFGAQDRETRALLFGAARSGVRQIEKEYLARGGERVPVAVTVRSVHGSAGQPLYSVGAVRDLRAARRLQEAERVRQQAEAANRAKSEFVARMSHELRTPLNAILGFAQLLDVQGGGRLTAGDRHWTGQIQRAGWHLLAMINDVLDLSRIEADTLELHMERLDLDELVHTSLEMVAETASRRGIAIRTELDPAARDVAGDRVRVRQVLINLLSNAVKYNREGGQILVRSRVPGVGRAQLEVHDTGMGMDEHQLGELFRPFNRLGQERTSVEGTGIGLAIAKRLAEMMGGELGARSVPGEGTVFSLTLARGEEPASRARAAAAEAAEPAPHPPARGRVLYIEDNEVNVEIMRAMLATRPGLALDIAADGLGGVEAARALRPDLILLDHELPDIDGVEVLRRLGADAATADTPVIMVSADAMGEQVQAALAAGARSFLAKPVNLGALLRAVDETLHATAAAVAHADH